MCNHCKYYILCHTVYCKYYLRSYCPLEQLGELILHISLLTEIISYQH